MSSIEEALLMEFEQHDELDGTERIALRINVRNKGCMIRILRRLNNLGLIDIIPSQGGRGCKTIYKRNRNQPGIPRTR